MRAVLIFVAVAAFGQTLPTFEAISIKPIPESVGYPPRKGYWVQPRMEDSRRFRALIHVDRLIEWAYNVRDFQILGGPSWMRNGAARFEFQATADHPVTEAEMRVMVQGLLAERFHLKLHHESKELPVYALVVGKNGPKLTESKSVTGGDGGMDIGNGDVIANGVPMSFFIKILTDNLDRPAVDRTNLTGHYDFKLNYDQSSLPDWRLGPALFGMVQELGLRLEPQKGPFDMIVVDSIEQPTEN